MRGHELAGFTWTLGVKVGLPIAIAGAVVLLVAFIACVAWAWLGDDPVVGVVVGGFVLLCLAGLVGGCLYGYYPYSSEYHQYRDVSGRVTSIHTRLVATDTDNGAATSQRFVVTLEGKPHPYAIDDTRAVFLNNGDKVYLRCIREHDSGSTNDGYACKWGAP